MQVTMEVSTGCAQGSVSTYANNARWATGSNASNQRSTPGSPTARLHTQMAPLPPLITQWRPQSTTRARRAPPKLAHPIPIKRQGFQSPLRKEARALPAQTYTQTAALRDVAATKAPVDAATKAGRESMAGGKC